MYITPKLKHRGILLLGGWTRLVQKAGPAVPVIVLVLALFAGRYALGNLGMNTDTRDMLSAELPWRQLDREYEALFPQYDNSLLAVIEAPTPDQAQDAAALLYQRLRQEDALFVDVYYARALPVFRESGLLYLDTAELQDLADNLAAMQPFLARLAREPSLAGLFAALGAALDSAAAGENIDVTPVLAQVAAAAAAVLDERPFRVSWQRLMSGAGAAQDDGPWREFILLQPRLDYGNLFPAAAALEKVRRLYEKLGLAADPGVALRLTGKAALAHEELQSVVQGARAAMVLALVLVTLILLAGLGSLKLALAAVASLAVGLVFTAAFAALTVGRLNLISVAFAVLYIGLGVDFAIHYCLRYRELLEGGEESRQALEYTATSVGGALFLCAVSTAIGFFAFIPTDYRGIAELGWISGFGMFISFATTMTVTPSLLSLAPAGKRPAGGGGRPVSGRWAALAALPAVHAGKILGAAALLAAGSCLALAALRFDYNPLNLQAQDSPALKAFRALLADNSLSPWSAVLVAADAAEAARYRRRFAQLPLVERVASIADFIPAAQEEKLAVIDEAGLLLGDLGEVQSLGGAAPGQLLAAVSALREKLCAARLDDPAAAALDENLARLLAEDDPPRRAAQLERLERAVLASLPGRLAALRESLNADFISLDNLAPALKERWLSADGRRRLEIYPQKDLQDNAALREFVRALQAVSPRVVGSPVLNLEAGAAVPAAFGQAFLYAFIVIALMLCLLLERKGDALLVLAPLLLAALLTAAAAAVMNLPLNFANVIALPLLLGMGVDSGIHLAHRFRAGLPGETSILATSSARAVVVSGLTTMGGIGNLAFSPHAGTAGMGKLLTLGIAITLACMLLVLPALLAYSERRRVAGGRLP